MGKEREIADSIRKLVGEIGFDAMLCTVVSVDDEATCTVKTVRSGSEYKNIKLNTNIKEDKGIYIFPKKDSYVIVTMTDRVNGFISMFSEIEKVTLKVNGIIEINEGKNDGLVKIKELTDKLNDLVSWCQSHTHILTPADGVTALLSPSPPVTIPVSGLIPKPPVPPQQFKKNDYENTKITH